MGDRNGEGTRGRAWRKVAYVVSRAMTAPARRPLWLRIAAVVGVGLALYLAGRVSGFNAAVSEPAVVREWVRSAGALGVIVFGAAFVGAQLTNVPAIVPLGFGVVFFGPVQGTVIGYAAALVGISIAFFLARSVGGQPLEEIERPFVKRLLARLDERPIRTVALVRLMLWVFPPVNYALAMSSVKYRDYIVGSSIGLIVPMSAAGAVMGWSFG